MSYCCRYCTNFILLQLVTVARHFDVGGVGVVIGGESGVVVGIVAGIGITDFVVSGFVVSGIVVVVGVDGVGLVGFGLSGVDGVGV